MDALMMEDDNSFFAKTNLTPDDLEVYSEPIADAVNAIHECSLGFKSKAELFAIFLQAVEKWAAIDAKLEQDDAA